MQDGTELCAKKPSADDGFRHRQPSDAGRRQRTQEYAQGVAQDWATDDGFSFDW